MREHPGVPAWPSLADTSTTLPPLHGRRHTTAGTRSHHLPVPDWLFLAALGLLRPPVVTRHKHPRVPAWRSLTTTLMQVSCLSVLHDCRHTFASSPCPRPSIPSHSWSLPATCCNHARTSRCPRVAAPAQHSHASFRSPRFARLPTQIRYSSPCPRTAFRDLLRNHRRVLDRPLASS